MPRSVGELFVNEIMMKRQEHVPGDVVVDGRIKLFTFTIFFLLVI